MLLAASAESQTAPRDTTIDGQHYTLHPIETLIAQLGRNAATPITYRHTAFQGRLFATLDTVYAPLDLEDIHFLDEVALNGVVFVAPVHIRQAVFANGLSLQRSRFSADVDFSAGQFPKHATFKEAEFRGGVNFSASRYTAVASFVAADFAGRENRFDRTAFDHAAYFDEAHFSGRADFQDATFADLASFKETVWQQGASFAGARFGGRALFWDARFAAETTFATARADGEIAFNRSTFTGPVAFAGFIFAQPALFNRVTCADEATFAGAYFRKTADFTDGTFRSDLRLDAIFNQALDLRRASIQLLDLQRPASSDSTFAAPARLYLQQTHYRHILVRWHQLAGHLAAADTLALDDLEPVYATLRRQLHAQGLKRDADACFVEWMERRRQHASWTDSEFYALSLLQTTTRYGTDPTHFAGSAICIVLLFGLAYRLGRDAIEMPHGDTSPSLAACLLFSLQTFIRCDASPLRLTGPIRLLADLQALTGWIYLGLLLAILLAQFS
ncbi:MAG: pentapeptide repeat-containing protein [Candidatus Latescibacterota bacterium]|nr:pentapeptide repeat-containing protein [Candidatus Latescibacterota bacterium]